MTSGDQCLKAKLLCRLANSILIEYQEEDKCLKAKPCLLCRQGRSARLTWRLSGFPVVTGGQTLDEATSWPGGQTSMSSLLPWTGDVVLIVSNLNVLKTDTFSARWVIQLVP